MSDLIWVTNSHKSKGKPDSTFVLIKGHPKGIKKYNSQQLIDLGMVGWYRRSQKEYNEL
jgi:hypothetical protein